MKITIAMIPEGGKTVQIAPSEPWVKDLIREALPRENPDSESVLGRMHISMLNENITVVGAVDLKLRPSCDRCLEPFDFGLNVPVRMDMTPLYRSRKERDEARYRGEEKELNKDDVEFCFYDGPHFDLKEIIREQIVLALPPRFLCTPACKGLCPRCGFNQNRGLCKCPSLLDPFQHL